MNWKNQEVRRGDLRIEFSFIIHTLYYLEQYEDSKFKRLNNAKENNNYDFIPSNNIDNSIKTNQLKKFEDNQYNLTKKDLAFANIKIANSNPNIHSDHRTSSSVVSENDGSKTSTSSVKSENLQELWKILDDDNNSQIFTQRENEIKMIKQRQKSLNNKNEYVIDQQLSARGEKKPIQGRTTVIPSKDVSKKPKIRNYNNKSDD